VWNCFCDESLRTEASLRDCCSPDESEPEILPLPTKMPKDLPSALGFTRWCVLGVAFFAPGMAARPALVRETPNQ
jgi:hypothetical protein